MWKGEAVTLLAVGPEQCAIRGEEGARIVVDTEGLVKVEKVKADWIVVSYYGKNQFAATEAEARELCTQLLALGSYVFSEESEEI